METLKTISIRKSTRSYKTKQISDKSLEIILNAGCAAPVGMGDYDSVHMTVIQNADMLDKITKAAAKSFGNPNMKPLYGAPTVIIVSGKPNSKMPNIEMADAACIIENMALAATDLGIGNVYLLGFIKALCSDKELLKNLNLPEGFVPLSAIALGYSSEIPEEKKSKHTIAVNKIK